MKTTFLINPVSGKGFNQQRLKTLKDDFSSQGGRYTYLLSEGRQDLIDKTRKALHEGAEQIVAVGGDGTVNAVVNGFFENDRPINPAARLAVYPSGTGSDYFKTVVSGKSVRDCKTIISEHQPRAVDIGKITFLNKNLPPKYFINITGVGISPVIVRMKNAAPTWVPGPLSYLWPAVKGVMSYSAPEVKISSESHKFEGKLLGAFIAKGKYSGGGMKFGGGVGLSDGFLGVTIFEDMPPLECLLKMGKLYTGDFSHENKILKMVAKKIVIESKVPVPVEYDGEADGETDIELTLLDQALNVCFPLK